jgi:GntR family transcriptional regulator
MLDRESPEPLYQQLAAILRQQITDGARRLPSITALAADYGVAEMTVRQAYDVLKDEGLVVAVPGKGMYAVKRA